MLSFFATLQFGNAAALFAALVSPLLILAYLHKSRFKRKLVSSVIILKTLAEQKKVKRKFKPPFRFFLELLALLLLVICAALPSINKPRNRIAIVVDNSLSMRAVSVAANSQIDSQTRFTQAVDLLKKWLSEQNSGGQYSLFQSSPKLTRVGPEFTSREQVSDILAEIAPTYSSDSLELAVNELAGSGQYDRVFVVTDRNAEMGEGGGEDNEQNSAGATIIETRKVGSFVPNVYFNNIKVISSGLGESKKKIVADIALSAAKPVEVSVSFFLLNSFPSAGEQLLAKQVVNISPSRITEIQFDFPETVSETAIFKFSLEVKDGAENFIDSLKEDNSAWVSWSANKSNSMLLVTAEDSAGNALGLANISGVEVKAVSPAEFARLSSTELENFSIIIFHQSAPSRALEQPTLLILPPATNPFFTVNAEANSARITSWVSEHPITSYLKVPLLKPEHILLFDVPAWAQSVVNVEAGSVLVAGDSRGIRFAAIGFELLPFEGAKTPAISILTLNLLNWLSGGGEFKSLTTGASFRLGVGKSWKVTAPSKQISQVTAKSAEAVVFPLPEPGPYLISSVDGPTKEEKTVIANPFHPEESSTFLATDYKTPAFVKHVDVSKEQQQPVWPPLLSFVLAVLFLDLLQQLYFRKQSYFRKSVQELSL